MIFMVCFTIKRVLIVFSEFPCRDNRQWLLNTEGALVNSMVKLLLTYRLLSEKIEKNTFLFLNLLRTVGLLFMFSVTSILSTLLSTVIYNLYFAEHFLLCWNNEPNCKNKSINNLFGLSVFPDGVYFFVNTFPSIGTIVL